LLDEAPIYSDVKSFPAEIFAGKVDILIGGFPCQPFSVAGKQEGSEDERNLWPDTIRLIRSLRPRYAFMENVPGLVAHPYFGTILGDLAQAGFDAEWGCFTASGIGASHRRERVFILAHAEGIGSEWADPIRDGSGEPEAEARDRSGNMAHANHTGDSTCGGRTYGHGAQENEGRDRQPQPEPTGQGGELADSEEHRIQEPRPTDQSESRHSPTTSVSNGEELAGLPEFPPRPGGPRWGWIIDHYPELAPATCKHGTRVRSGVQEAESAVCNMADAWKISDRVAALMMLGNAVVPAQAEHAFRTLASRI
jgi:DNA (cytosine-5)-methyltransferase 1